MNERALKELLQRYHQGRVSLEEVVSALKDAPLEEDLGFAKIDHHRALRRSFPEVVYCESKSPEQVAQIMEKMADKTDGNILGTRARPEVYEAVKVKLPQAVYHPIPRAITLLQGEQRHEGNIAVVSAGTSDMPVAEEAALTAELMGNRVDRIYDIGVAGIHRLLSRRERLYRARVIIVVAGMEGALASVVGGLVNVPVIAVPTSVGYGASFKGVAALLGMLNSCAPGVAVVNIDNGFGAAYTASLINQGAGCLTC